MHTIHTTHRPAIGDVVKAWKKAAGMRSKDLAAAAGLTRAYISELESNRIANPGIDRLEKIAAALNIPLNDLIEHRLPSETPRREPTSSSSSTDQSTENTKYEVTPPNSGTTNPNDPRLPSTGSMIDWLLASPWLGDRNKHHIGAQAINLTARSVADVLIELLASEARRRKEDQNLKTEHHVTDQKINIGLLFSSENSSESKVIEPKYSIDNTEPQVDPNE